MNDFSLTYYRHYGHLVHCLYKNIDKGGFKAKVNTVWDSMSWHISDVTHWGTEIVFSAVFVVSPKSEPVNTEQVPAPKFSFLLFLNVL